MAFADSFPKEEGSGLSLSTNVICWFSWRLLVVTGKHGRRTVYHEAP